ncbi:CAP domain-containing protein [Deinococcus wulumuqiensis]|uniref:SCP domain-containing protein n=1 Tax=Deinococcus wulumuqiensis TaxID=980427 RepID=A0AAV4K771_9DEIO|nr:CAP domain-containing protein [Deinococcus wulumuqiensis]QII20067.1 CAP domain-containing protein [Deinococcus wulumuqiensis R12]GGI87347.1 hypothetical protein GCM10010914_22290 [Deinococcus wulumuqiensis]GGP30002.1 hypothetical protein GCM10008021_16530 [Deinococcus wulumuqiensis]
MKRLLLLLALALAACSPAPQPAPAPVPAPLPAPAPVPTPAPPAAQPAEELARLINGRRASGSNCNAYYGNTRMSVLLWDAGLARAAQDHADDMAARGYFGDTPDFPPLNATRRAQRAGIGYAFSHAYLTGDTAAQAFAHAEQAPDFCRGAYFPDLSHVGVGRSAAGWVVIFGQQ